VQFSIYNTIDNTPLEGSWTFKFTIDARDPVNGIKQSKELSVVCTAQALIDELKACKNVLSIITLSSGLHSSRGAACSSRQKRQ
jgi:hypothetical protein